MVPLYISASRLLFPDREKEEQKGLAGQLLEQSGVSYTLRAQDLTVEQFGAVTNNYQKNFVNSPPPPPNAQDSSPHAVEAENTLDNNTSESMRINDGIS